ncbi:hypothetical protein GGX14DRAFT_397902 [Mycena pura]|uniref:Uncharacterized protein n=1 Tax=Mycena pura TaxID=153505 RepID=A0AAD6V7E4_9AGAR|nr:hypothetical protein GGX14DRAFT_397902 [Mycena pura]
MEETIDMQIDPPQEQHDSDPPVDSGPPAEIHISIEPHPNDVDAHIEVISLSGASSTQNTHRALPPARDRIRNLLVAARPFAPWATLSDFEYTETAVGGVLSEKVIKAQLRGMTGPWSGPNPNITLKTYHEYRKVLMQARGLAIPFQTATVEAELWGEKIQYSFQYRDIRKNLHS